MLHVPEVRIARAILPPASVQQGSPTGLSSADAVADGPEEGRPGHPLGAQAHQNGPGPGALLTRPALTL